MPQLQEYVFLAGITHLSLSCLDFIIRLASFDSSGVNAVALISAAFCAAFLIEVLNF